MKKQKMAPPEAPKKVQVALLDANDIYQGLTEINESDLTDAHLPLPNGCDLPIGKHKLDRVKRAFMPMKTANTNAGLNPSAENAIVIGLISLHEQGVLLPQETLQWLDRCTATLVLTNAETQQLVQAFKSRKKG